jgi:hypothetical protein
MRGGVVFIFASNEQKNRDRVLSAAPSGSECTGASPENPSARAAGVTSIARLRMNGPRSLIRTTTERPLRRLVTCTLVRKTDNSYGDEHSITNTLLLAS